MPLATALKPIIAQVEPETVPTVNVTGPLGMIVADARTGDVLSALGFDRPDAYSAIERIDVAEWVRFWKSDLTGAQLDLSDVGHWTPTGYHAADPDWREAVREVREARRERTGSAVINTIKQ